MAPGEVYVLCWWLLALTLVVYRRVFRLNTDYMWGKVRLRFHMKVTHDYHDALPGTSPGIADYRGVTVVPRPGCSDDVCTAMLSNSGVARPVL